MERCLYNYHGTKQFFNVLNTADFTFGRNNLPSTGHDAEFVMLVMIKDQPGDTFTKESNPDDGLWVFTIRVGECLMSADVIERALSDCPSAAVFVGISFFLFICDAQSKYN